MTPRRRYYRGHDLVTLRDVRVNLGGNHILRGVSADVGRGRITALIGLNGSGKTTLLRALLGEVSYTGRIEFHCGHDHTRPTPAAIGLDPMPLPLGVPATESGIGSNCEINATWLGITTTQGQ